MLWAEAATAFDSDRAGANVLPSAVGSFKKRCEGEG